MEDTQSLEQIVEKVVSRLLDGHIPQLRVALVRNVVQELRPELSTVQGAGGQPGVGKAGDLLAAVSAIHVGNTQKEILKALLDNLAPYCGRGALFVIKSGIATGWQGRGFENSDEIKDFSLDLRTGIAAQAMQSRMASAGTTADLDARFVTHFRGPADDRAIVLPLSLKDKVAALVYADSGTNSARTMDASALELLVAATSAWLEVISLRKQTQKEGAPEIADRPEPAKSSPSFADPFASHSAVHAATTATEIPTAVSSTAVAPAHHAIAEIPLTMAAAAGSSTVGLPQISSEDQETQKKAQRFARLLIDEIKLYNQVKMIEGRKNRDLYDRLKEDIEKSRATYQKRYGNTAAGANDYFNHELVHILAEDDASLLGTNFQRN